MNDRALQIMGQLRRPLTMLPGAMSAAIWESRTWTLVTVTAVNDEAVFTLALILGLGEPQERRVSSAEGYRRWLYASAERKERGRGRLTFEIVGPRHQEGLSGPSSPDGMVGAS